MKDLQALLKAKEADFELVQKEISKRTEEISELENELCRIQGEYRLLCQLIEEESETSELTEVEVVEE